MITTSIRLFKRKLNQANHSKGNQQDHRQDQFLVIKDGLIDIVFLETHLGIRPLVADLIDGMNQNNIMVTWDGISSTILDTWWEIASN